MKKFSVLILAQDEKMSFRVDAQTIAESPEVAAIRNELHAYVDQRILNIIDTIKFLENDEEPVLNGTPPKLMSVFDKRRNHSVETPDAKGDLTKNKNELLVKQFVNRESLLT